MSMFGPKMITYSVYSEKDPRFNKSFRDRGFITSGTPDFVHDWIEQRRKELKLKEAPDDLRVSSMKD